jgi:type VI secretion system secreted protein VgrG
MVGGNAGIFLETKAAMERTASAIISATMPPAVAGIVAADEDDGDNEGYPAVGVKDEAKPDCSYLDGSKGRIDAPANLYGHTNTVTVSSGKQTTFDFPGGGSGAATQYDATVSGHPVRIFVSTRLPAAGYGVPDGKQIARALETVPREQYKDLDKVSISAEANPQDAVWQKIYRNPSFSSAATANISQGIAFYPWKGFSTIPQQYVDSTMLHETGHLWSESLWKDLARKQAWLDAVTNDAHAPSQYAMNNANEDFAELANMYWSSKGTPCEVEGRKRYPGRYAYFDKISK